MTFDRLCGHQSNVSVLQYLPNWKFCILCIFCHETLIPFSASFKGMLRLRCCVENPSFHQNHFDPSLVLDDIDLAFHMSLKHGFGISIIISRSDFFRRELNNIQNLYWLKTAVEMVCSVHSRRLNLL